MQIKNTMQWILFTVFELLAMAFFFGFMMTESTYKLILLVVVLAVGLYAYHRLERSVFQLSQSVSRYKPFHYALFVLFVLSLPLFFRKSPYLLHICIMSCLYIIMAIGLNFCLGSANMSHFAASAFFGMGAYSSALLSIHFHTGFWVNIFVASALAGIFGILLSIPIIKTKTYYLALISMAFGLIFYQFITTVKFTGGPAGLSGVPRPSLFGYDFMKGPTLLGFELPFQANYFYVAVIFTLLVFILARRVMMSWMGLMLNYIREDEIATSCQGIRISFPKIFAFALNATLTGFAGTFYAHYITYVGPPDADIMISVVLVIIVILGGMDNLAGIAFAAALLTILPEKFRAFQDYRLLVYGVIVLLMLLFRPSGLFPKRLRSYKRL
jgi:ABC-type branched-subunit amino acid transport system permease subunit